MPIENPRRQTSPPHSRCYRPRIWEMSAPPRCTSHLSGLLIRRRSSAVLIILRARLWLQTISLHPLWSAACLFPSRSREGFLGRAGGVDPTCTPGVFDVSCCAGRLAASHGGAEGGQCLPSQPKAPFFSIECWEVSRLQTGTRREFRRCSSPAEGEEYFCALESFLLSPLLTDPSHPFC